MEESKFSINLSGKQIIFESEPPEFIGQAFILRDKIDKGVFTVKKIDKGKIYSNERLTPFQSHECQRVTQIF